MKKIPPFRLIKIPLDDDAKNLAPFRWADDEVGNRNKIGGNPDYLAEISNPKCSCGNEMTFYAQIDSITRLSP